MHRERGAVLDEQRTCVSQRAADDRGSGITWCKARYIFKAFPASAVSARNMTHVFYASKRPSVNAVTSAGEGESDPLLRTSVEMLPGHRCVSGEERCTLPSTPWRWRGGSAEDLLKYTHPGLDRLTCVVLAILLLC